MKHSVFPIWGEKGKKAVKTAKAGKQRDSLWSILLFGEEFRKDLLKKKTKRGEKGKAEQKEAR